MKKLLLASSIAMAAVTTSSAFADECPNPGSITILQNSNGSFTVQAPAGYTYADNEGYPISQTGPVSLWYAITAADPSSVPLSPTGPYSNIKAPEIGCWYGVAYIPNWAGGSFQGGTFLLTKNGTVNSTYNLGKDWAYPPHDVVYMCNILGSPSADCSFSLSGSAPSEVRQNPWSV